MKKLLLEKLETMHIKILDALWDFGKRGISMDNLTNQVNGRANPSIYTIVLQRLEESRHIFYSESLHKYYLTSEFN